MLIVEGLLFPLSLHVELYVVPADPIPKDEGEEFTLVLVCNGKGRKHLEQKVVMNGFEHAGSLYLWRA